MSEKAWGECMGSESGWRIVRCYKVYVHSLAVRSCGDLGKILFLRLDYLRYNRKSGQQMIVPEFNRVLEVVQFYEKAGSLPEVGEEAFEKQEQEAQ